MHELTLLSASCALFLPESWKKRRPDPHHRAAYITWPQVMDLIGSARFKSKWSGKEWLARSIEEISLDPLLQEVLGHRNFYNDADAPFQDDESEKAAYERKRAVLQECLEWLVEGKTKAFQFEQDGSKQEILPQRWEKEDAFDLSECAVMSDKKPFYFEREHIEMLISGTLPVVDPVIKKNQNITYPQRGRRPKFNWNEFYAELTRKVHDEGIPETQAAWEQSMTEWCVEKWGEENCPSESSIREKIGPVYRKLRGQ